MEPELKVGNLKAAKEAVRAGQWEKAASLLEPLAASGSPLLINDLAAALHQAGQSEKALERLKLLEPDADLPAIVLLNRTFIEHALKLQKEFDPRWEHKDHDGEACPDTPPFFSVIVRTCNRPDYLEEALASLAAQTFKDFEALVINDGGDPAAQDVVKRSGLARARYLRTAKQGRVAALNTGLEMAHGRFITGLDDDDALYPAHLAGLARALSREDAAPVVCPSYVRVYYKKTGHGALKPGARKEVRLDRFGPEVLDRTNPYTILTAVKRECYQEVGRFNPGLELGEDWEMWLRLRDRFAIRHLGETTAEVRIRPGDENLTYRRLRDKYFWDNTILFMHRRLPLFSFPKDPRLTEAYAKGLQLLDRALRDRTELIHLLNLRGLWDMKKPYRWFADQGRWFLELGDKDAARRFYLIASRLSPLEPKTWAGWAKAALGRD